MFCSLDSTLNVLASLTNELNENFDVSTVYFYESNYSAL